MRHHKFTIGGFTMIFVGLDVAKDKHNCSIEYLRPARGDLFCEATPKKLGWKLSVIQAAVTDTAGKMVATGTFPFFMTQPGEV